MTDGRYWEHLERDLIKLESIDPAVTEARQRLDETCADILRKSPRQWPLAGIQTTAPTSAFEAAPPVTMESMMAVIDKLREQGFPLERRTVRTGSMETFRRWAAEQMPLVKDERMARADRLMGIDVVTDADLPPDVIEIREGGKVLGRMVLPPTAEALERRSEIEDIGRTWGAP